VKESCEGTIIHGNHRGDEGKGRITDEEAATHDIVARFGGGQNAGHTVSTGEHELSLHILPSGIAHEGKMNVIGNGCVIDPVGAMDELEQVEASGISIGLDNLRISSAAHLVLPHMISQDEIRDAGPNGQGSTKRGIAQTYAAKHMRTGKRVEDINHSRDELVEAAREGLLRQADERKQAGLEPLDVDREIERFIAAAIEIGRYSTDTPLLLNRLLSEGENILAEGAQAYSLDIDHGMYPFTTSSGTSALAAPQGLGVPAKHFSRIIGVAKLTQSHVGGGPFVTEICDKELAEQVRGPEGEIDSEFGKSTGRPRRVGHLDIPSLRRSQITSGDTETAVTKLDLVKRYGEMVAICVSYEMNGDTLDVAPSSAMKLAKCTPIYEHLPVWQDDIEDIREYEKLPVEAKSYIEFIEELTGIPITAIGVGYQRDQIIRRRQNT